ncbi:MAG: response regulator, partial [Gammaproteobacteria bacterium]|nr:response regulator [Gammaproteobacteria bacterium]
IISQYLEDTGRDYILDTAEDGMIAWEKLAESAGTPNEYDVVLLDRMMPRMDGMEVLHLLSKHETLRNVPVIFQTAKSSKEDILEGMSAGAFYYLTKPFEEDMLLSVVNRALRDRAIFKRLSKCRENTERMMVLLDSAEFHFKTLNEARNIASMLSNAFPVPDRAFMGIKELMINAVEHGNLEISYDDKSHLNLTQGWEDEVHRRQELPEYRDRFATVSYQREDNCFSITVRDGGAGFDWERFMEFDASRVLDNHGRGIAIAKNLAFSELEYSDGGRTVRASFTCEESESDK